MPREENSLFSIVYKSIDLHWSKPTTRDEWILHPVFHVCRWFLGRVSDWSMNDTGSTRWSILSLNWDNVWVSSNNRSIRNRSNRFSTSTVERRFQSRQVPNEVPRNPTRSHPKRYRDWKKKSTAEWRREHSAVHSLDELDSSTWRCHCADRWLWSRNLRSSDESPSLRRRFPLS